MILSFYYFITNVADHHFRMFSTRHCCSLSSSLYLSIYPSIYPPPFLYLFTYPLSILYLSIYPFLFLILYLFFLFSISFSLSSFLSLSICISFITFQVVSLDFSKIAPMLLAVGLSNGDVSTVFDCTLWYCPALFLIILYYSIIYYRVCTILYCLPIYYRVCTMLSFSIVCHTVVHLFWAQCNYGSPCQTLTQLLLYDAFFHTFLWQFSSLFFSCLPIFLISFTSWTIICLHLTSRWVYMTRRGKLTGAHPFNLQPAW